MNEKHLQAKKNHHYIWAHYLARWSDDGKNVWHTTQTGKIILDSVKAFCKEDYFYKAKELTPNHVHIIKLLSSRSPSFLQKQHADFLSDFLIVQEADAAYQTSGMRDHQADQAIHALKCNMMENLHSSHEGETQTVIDALASGEIAILAEGDNLINFVAFLGQQITRTKSFKEAFSSTLPKFSTIGNDAIQVHRLIEDCWWFVSYMLGINIGWSLYESRKSDSHCLLINKTETSFITSDQPVVNVHPNLKERNVVPLTDDTCDFFFPLSPNAAYMINKSDMFHEGITVIPEVVANEMNEKVAKAARTHIIGADCETVAFYSKQVGVRDAIVKDHFAQL